MKPKVYGPACPASGRIGVDRPSSSFGHRPNLNFQTGGKPGYSAGVVKLVVCGLLMLLARLEAAGEPRRILLLYSFGRDFTPFDEVAETFRSEFAQHYRQPYVIQDASLEMARFDGPDRDGPLLDYLRAMYRDGPPDLLVPIGAQAAAFCVRNRKALFPDPPLLVIGLDQRRIGEVGPDPNTTFVGVRLDLAGYMDNLLRLRPGTRTVYLMGGTSPIERFWEAEAFHDWQVFSDRIVVRSLSDQPVPRMRETVKSLPEDAAIFLTLMNLDAAGLPYERESALRAVHETSRVPIFGSMPRQLGLGIVGGPLYPGSRVGATAAATAARILNGEATSSIPTTIIDEAPPTYDWRELKRWNIPESRLPAGSVVRFRPPRLWETHGTAMWIGLGFLILQSVTIASLFAARRRSRRMARSLDFAADVAKVGLWWREAHGDRLISSAGCRRIFGFQPDAEPSEREMLDRIPEDDRRSLQQAFERSARGNEAFSLEHRVRWPDGTIRWVSTSGMARPGRAPGEYRTSGASVDVSEQHQAASLADLQRRELAHLSRVSSLGVLSGALAHEINQPLGIILSNAQAAQYLLEEEHPDLDEVRAILEDIVSEDRRAGNVIHRLRALLRRGETRLEPIDVRETFQEVLKLTRSELIRRNVLADLRLESQLPPVQADAVQLQQVLLNLITNACDAMDDNPPGQRVVSFEARFENDEVRLAVRDRGVGLPADVELLFTPFHSSKPDGLGMGLAICRTLISAQGGRLWAEPNPDGRGAAFHVSLPPCSPPP